MTISYVENLSTWKSVMWSNFSTWQIFLHGPGPSARDKYEVCLSQIKSWVALSSLVVCLLRALCAQTWYLSRADGPGPWRKICHVEKFQISIHLPWGEIWNFSLLIMWRQSRFLHITKSLSKGGTFSPWPTMQTPQWLRSSGRSSPVYLSSPEFDLSSPSPPNK